MNERWHRSLGHPQELFRVVKFFLGYVCTFHAAFFRPRFFFARAFTLAAAAVLATALRSAGVMVCSRAFPPLPPIVLKYSDSCFEILDLISLSIAALLYIFKGLYFSLDNLSGLAVF